MSETKWTPGPWQAKRSGCISNRDGGELIATTGYRVAVVGGVAGEEDDANARLIAAAPEMYEAQAPLLERAERLIAQGDETVYIRVAREEIAALRAAKDKADGKEQKPEGRDCLSCGALNYGRGKCCDSPRFAP